MSHLVHNVRHTYPLPPTGSGLYIRLKALVVYLRLMIVSITLTSREPDVLEVLAVLEVAGGGGGGSDLPVVGTSPAKIDVDSAHISTTANANFFMGVLLLVVLCDVGKDVMILT